jgi:serine/threonine-protein kinase
MKTEEQAVAEFVLASEQGNPPDSQQWLAEHAHIATELAEFLEMHTLILDARESATTSATECTLGPPNSEHSNAEAAGLKRENVKRGYAHSEDFSSEDREPSISVTRSLANVPTPPLGELAIGRVFGDYEILEEIDRGGMGVVYKARHTKIHRLVALKIIRTGELASDEETVRFQVEAGAAAALSHSGIVQIYDLGSVGSMVYYTMAFIEGQNLAEFMTQTLATPTLPMSPTDPAPIDSPHRPERLSPEWICTTMLKICDAIEHAHSRGVFHRDLKPANILLQNDDQPIVIDFGLAKLHREENSPTITGQILGTPSYIAPEIVTGSQNRLSESEIRNAETYSIGAVFYFLCARQAPFNGPTPFDVMLQVLDREPIPPSKLNSTIPAVFDAICSKAISKNPKDRYQSVRELADDLKRWHDGEPISISIKTFPARIVSWWRREPILVSHLIGIGMALAIVVISHVLQRSLNSALFARMSLMIGWILAAFGLQLLFRRDRFRDQTAMLWAIVDVVIFTSLVMFAEKPRGLLLIGYPMMIAASGMFYRIRFVVSATILCLAGLAVLCLVHGFTISNEPQTAALSPMIDDLGNQTSQAIFASGLVLVGLIQAAMIRRVRKANRSLQRKI